MSYESSAEPIKIGYLMDFLLPEGFAKRYFKDVPQPSDLVFKNAAEQGLISLACRQPIFWSGLLANGRHTEVGVLTEQAGSVAVWALQAAVAVH